VFELPQDRTHSSRLVRNARPGPDRALLSRAHGPVCSCLAAAAAAAAATLRDAGAAAAADKHLQRLRKEYQDPEKYKGKGELAGELADIQQIMRKNIVEVLNRGEQLESARRAARPLRARRLQLLQCVGSYANLACMCVCSRLSRVESACSRVEAILGRRKETKPARDVQEVRALGRVRRHHSVCTLLQVFLLRGRCRRPVPAVPHFLLERDAPPANARPRLARVRRLRTRGGLGRACMITRPRFQYQASNNMPPRGPYCIEVGGADRSAVFKTRALCVCVAVALAPI
jgi:hypothetical protein